MTPTRIARPPKTPKITLRIPDVDLARARTEVLRLAPFQFSQTDVLRMAVTMGLEQVESIKLPARRKKSG